MSSIPVVVGAGYAGLATAAALLHRGACGVAIVDRSEGRLQRHVADLLAGRPPLGEPGMEALADPRVAWYRDIGERARGADVFVCVGTPGRGHDLDHDAVMNVTAAALRLSARSVVVRSTVTPVGAAQACGLGRLRVAVAPEFLREGHAYADAVDPSRVVVGCVDTTLAARIARLLADDARPVFLLESGPAAAVVKTGSNAALATLVQLADSIANVCEAYGVDYDDARRAIEADARLTALSRFSPGLGAGGPCLPKDLAALAYSARDPFLLRASTGCALGDSDGVDHVHAVVSGLLHSERRPIVGVLGLGFKPDSQDWRSSPAAALARSLGHAHEGRVLAADDRVDVSERAELADEVAPAALVASEQEAAAADVLVVVSADAARRLIPTPKQVVVDPYRLLSAEALLGAQAAWRRGDGWLKGGGPG